MGKKGGNTTKQRQSADFYSRIGKMGGAAKRGKRDSCRVDAQRSMIRCATRASEWLASRLTKRAP